jgi:hypothetical protein
MKDRNLPEGTITLFTTQDKMIAGRDAARLFEHCDKILVLAAQLYANGDKSRVHICSNATLGTIDIFVDGELIERPADASEFEDGTD